MSRFVESIKYLNGLHYNLEIHQERFDKTRLKFHPEPERILLENFLKPQSDLEYNRLYKCRVLYDQEIETVLYESYQPRTIDQYYLVVCPDTFDYTYKVSDRTFFDNAQQKNQS
ncbi:MAG: hypothetical protein HC905_06650 [Bacteroidales bacterium]|nr:hypothetical protein [Bacteroidales bacterium]